MLKANLNVIFNFNLITRNAPRIGLRMKQKGMVKIMLYAPLSQNKGRKTIGRDNCPNFWRIEG